MSFVKGVITGVLAVAGVFLGAAVVEVIKDEKKERAEMEKVAEEMDEMIEEDDKACEEAMDQFDKHVGSKLDKMKASE